MTLSIGTNSLTRVYTVCYSSRSLLGKSSGSKKDLLHMKILNETESPIYILLCILCFQKQPFRFLLLKLYDKYKCMVELVLGV